MDAHLLDDLSIADKVKPVGMSRKPLSYKTDSLPMTPWAWVA